METVTGVFASRGEAEKALLEFVGNIGGSGLRCHRSVVEINKV